MREIDELERKLAEEGEAVDRRWAEDLQRVTESLPYLRVLNRHRLGLLWDFYQKGEQAGFDEERAFTLTLRYFETIYG